MGQPLQSQIQSSTGAITTTTDYNQSASSIPTYQLVATLNSSAGQESLESSGSSTDGHHGNSHPSEGEKLAIDMKLVNEKTKQLSLDSAYTSEADLDASHNSTATNSRAASPKLAAMPEKVEVEESDKTDKESDIREDETKGTEVKSTEDKPEKEEDKKAKPSPLLHAEFTPTFQPTNGVFAPVSPQQYYAIPQQYVSPPLSPLAVQVGPQATCFTYVPPQEVQPHVTLMPGNAAL